MKKLLYILLAFLPLTAFAGGLTVVQGGTGTTTIPAAYFLIGSTTLHTDNTQEFLGTSTIAGNLQINGNLQVTGQSILSVVSSGAFTSTGLITGTSFTASSNTASNLPYASSTSITTTGYTAFATGGGNVGIGTTSPAQPLSVNGKSYFAGNVGIGASNGNVPVYVLEPAGAGVTVQNMSLYDNTAQAADVGGGIAFGGYGDTSNTIANFGLIKGGKNNNTSGDNGGYLAFSSHPNGGILTEAMRITSTGNVGIATTSPWKTLSVVGGLVATNLDTFVTSDSAVCYRGTGNGLITFDSGVSSCIVSSRKVKHNILNISTSDSLKRIMQLSPVSFNYNGTNKPDLGLIAEDVANIDKRYAQYNDKNEPKAINWSAITADLVKAIQNILARLTGLEAKVEKQQKEIDSLQTQINQLKHRP